MQFGGTALQSAAGVQQGDPLGPLLFASALQPLALELRQGPLDLAVFYLDDGVVAGDVSAVSAALLHVQQRAASFGLCLNLAKCEVVTPGRAGAADLAAALPATLLRTHDGNDRVLHNFEFLGASVGDDTFVAEHTRARVRKPCLCWMPSPSCQTHKLHSDFFEPVLGTPDLSTACGAIRLCPNKQLWTTLTA